MMSDVVLWIFVELKKFSDLFQSTIFFNSTKIHKPTKTKKLKQILNNKQKIVVSEICRIEKLDIDNP